MATGFLGLLGDVGLQNYLQQRRGLTQQLMYAQQQAMQQHQLDAFGYSVQWTDKELASMKRDEDDFIFLNVQEEVKLHNSLFED